MASAQQCGPYIKDLAVGEVYEVVSPRYPQNYPRNSDCSWKITAPVGNKVEFYCADVDIPESTDCTQDVLSVQAKKFCSSGQIYRINKSPDHSIDVTFKSTTNQGKFYCKANTKSDPCTCGRRKSVSIINSLTFSVQKPLLSN